MFNVEDFFNIEFFVYSDYNLGIKNSYQMFIGDVLKSDFNLSNEVKEVIIQEKIINKDGRDKCEICEVISRIFVGEETTLKEVEEKGYKINNQNGRFDLSKLNRIIVLYNEDEKEATVCASLKDNDLSFRSVKELEKYLITLANSFTKFENEHDNVRKLVRNN